MKDRSTKPATFSSSSEVAKEPSIAIPFIILLTLVISAAIVLFFRIPSIQYLMIGDSTVLFSDISQARAASISEKHQDTLVIAETPTPTLAPTPAPTPVPVTPAPTIDPGPLLSITSETGEHSVIRFQSIKLSVVDIEDDVTIVWESTDPSVAQVNSDGTVYGKDGGSCWIKATDEKGVTGSFLLSVEVPVTSIWFETNPYELDIGYSDEPNPITSPLDATDTSYVLTSDDPSIVRIDGSKIIGVSEGRTIITATAKSGASGETWVNVVPVRAKSLRIMNAPETLVAGQSLQLFTELLPADTADQTLTWSTGNDYLISISPSGMLTAKHPGTCGIAVKSSNGLRDYIEITVTE